MTENNLPISAPTPLLDVQNLKMWFPLRSGLLDRHVGYVKAVDDVSLRIFRGETVGLVGESGCGKTTVGRCIVRAYDPTGGKILYNEGEDRTQNLRKSRVHIRNFQSNDKDGSASEGHVIDLAKLSGKDLKPYRREIRMIFQDPYSSLNPRMTVFEIVGEVLQVNQLVPASGLKDKVAQLLHQVGLRPEYMQRYPHAFSGGERQRIVIARALATDPRLIVADEAISALDVSIRAQILNLLEDLQAELGLTYLFIAHDLSVVRHICDRVNVMYVGKLVESADATALYTHPKHPYTEALMSSVPIHDPRLRRRGRRIRLEGEVADPTHPPSGCYFHPRCPYAAEQCKREEPLPRSVTDASGQEHVVACHFAESLTLRGAISETVS